MNKTDPNPESNRVREENVLNGLLRLLYIILIEIELKKSVAIIIPCRIHIRFSKGVRSRFLDGLDPDTVFLEGQIRIREAAKKTFFF